jgi:hypothetical protein
LECDALLREWRNDRSRLIGGMIMDIDNEMHDIVAEYNQLNDSVHKQELDEWNEL